MTEENKVCPNCKSTDIEYDIMDLMGDGKEKDFGKTVMICKQCHSWKVIEE